jgi:hypothetical protein
MDKKYMCYCGLYCENCKVKAEIGPAAAVLYGKMEEMGFGGIIAMIPNGEGFWKFLTDLAEDRFCISCRDGGGDPACKIRICAREKGIEMCALCKEYPCELLRGNYLERVHMLKEDNILLRDQGIEKWAKLQDKRKKKGIVYRNIEK